MHRIEPLGDRAWLARFGTEAEAAAWTNAVREASMKGVLDIVLAYRSAAVYADPDRIDPAALGESLRSLEFARVSTRPADVRTIEIPVLYDGEDLPDVARRAGLTVDEVIACHASRDYAVYAVGFLPGFPYAGELPPELSGLPRRGEPRISVPAGSVAIAGRQTGIYPSSSPGGWHLLGRTPSVLADAARGFFPIRAGDRIRFLPIDREEFLRIQGLDLGRRFGVGGGDR